MHRLRRGLRSVVAAWLAAELVAFAAAPVAMAWDHAVPAAAHRADVCCPGIAPGQMCPMHHAREGGRTCTMRASCCAGDAVLISLAVVGADAPVRSAVPLTPTAGDRLHSLAIATIGRPELPESPPPRV